MDHNYPKMKYKLPLSTDEYQAFVVRNISDKVPATMEVAWALMGLVAESGETIEVYEKALRKKGELDATDYEKIKDELGDVLWYLTAAAASIEVDLIELIEHNVAKLNARGYK